MPYLAVADIANANLDSFAAAQWAAKSAAQQTDLLQWASDQVDAVAHRTFASGSITKTLWGNDTDLLILPEIPITALTAVGVYFPGQISPTTLDATRFVVDAWGRTIRTVQPQATWVRWGYQVGWPENMQFQLTYTYGVNFATAPVSGSDPRLVQLYNDIRRGTLLFLIRRLHLDRAPSNVQRMKRGDSEEVGYAQSALAASDGTIMPSTPLEADIRAFLQPWIWRGDPR